MPCSSLLRSNGALTGACVGERRWANANSRAIRPACGTIRTESAQRCLVDLRGETGQSSTASGERDNRREGGPAGTPRRVGHPHEGRSLHQHTKDKKDGPVVSRKLRLISQCAQPLCVFQQPSQSIGFCKKSPAPCFSSSRARLSGIAGYDYNPPFRIDLPNQPECLGAIHVGHRAEANGLTESQVRMIRDQSKKLGSDRGDGDDAGGD